MNVFQEIDKVFEKAFDNVAKKQRLAREMEEAEEQAESLSRKRRKAEAIAIAGGISPEMSGSAIEATNKWQKAERQALEKVTEYHRFLMWKEQNEEGE